MNLSSEGYEILLLVVFLKHRLLRSWENILEKCNCMIPSSCALCFVHGVAQMGAQPGSSFLWPQGHPCVALKSQLTTDEKALKGIGFFGVLSTLTPGAQNKDSHTKQTLQNSVFHMLGYVQKIIHSTFVVSSHTKRVVPNSFYKAYCSDNWNNLKEKDLPYFFNFFFYWNLPIPVLVQWLD